MYAIENGPSGFDPAAPGYLPKHRFLMLMRNERLAELRTALRRGEPYADHPPRGPRGGARRPADAGRARRDRGVLRRFCADELRGPPKVLHAEGHSFSDVAKKVVSIINLASVAALEDAVGAPVDPLRFRGNLYVDGWPAWHEFDLLDREIAVGRGAAEGRQAHRALRGDRGRTRHRHPRPADPAHLMRAFGHADCGVYAEVIEGGPIAVGDAVNLIDERQRPRHLLQRLALGRTAKKRRDQAARRSSAPRRADSRRTGSCASRCRSARRTASARPRRRRRCPSA